MAKKPSPEPLAPFQPPKPGQLLKIPVRADYFEGQIDVEDFSACYPQYAVVGTSPLILQFAPGQYAVILRFGTVVTWALSDSALNELVEQIKTLPGALDVNEEVRDTLTVHVGADRDQVTFDAVWMRELTLEKVKIVSLALAQSVALDRFEDEVSGVLSKFAPIVSELRKTGKLLMSAREVLKAVGFALDVRGAVLANLTLFDSPPETWESEALAHLDSQLYDQFDLEERLAAVNQKLAFIADLNETMFDVLQGRKSNRLEWIIIVLIIVEIVLVVVYDLMR